MALALRMGRPNATPARPGHPMRLQARKPFFPLLLLFLLPVVAAFAETPAGDELQKQLADLSTRLAAAQTAGDNAWLLTSSAFVLLMTTPGLILFYGGLVRARNVLSICMQSVFLAGAVSALWLVFGYSLAFAPGNPVVGGLQYLFLRGVGAEPAKYATTVPHQSFMLFQLMFAIITPALITGAFAERFRFKAFVPFALLWSVVVYLPLAHMVWGDGGLLNAVLPAKGWSVPALDFAGGTVVHISSGVSALVCALFVGRRLGYPGPQFVPHNIVFSVIGAGLLWMGWFGFNAGSALCAGSLASSAFAATHFSAAGATLSWLTLEWLLRGKPSVLGAVSGTVAGLVAITPGSGFVEPWAGLVIGLIGGAVCFVAVFKLKAIFKYDDSLDVFGVHGVGGILGALLTGIFASSRVNPVFGPGKAVGLLEGNAGQLLNQVIAVGITVSLAVAATTVLLVVVDKAIGIRPAADDEEQGLDIADHGESGYHQAG